MSLVSAETDKVTSEEPGSYIQPNESASALVSGGSTAVSDNEKERGAPKGSSTSSRRNVTVVPPNEDPQGSYPPPRRSGTNNSSRSNATGELPPLKKRLTDLFISERKVKREPTWKESVIACVKASWLNVLLVFIPVRTAPRRALRERAPELTPDRKSVV